MKSMHDYDKCDEVIVSKDNNKKREGFRRFLSLIEISCGKRKPIRLRMSVARQLASALVDAVGAPNDKYGYPVNLPAKSVKSMVLNANEVGVKQCEDEYHNHYFIIKARNQPRIWLSGDVAGFLALHMRQESRPILRTPHEMDEYFKQKMLNDV